MAEESSNRGEQTREAIIAAAHALFLERGYHGTSMRAIAQQAGIALGGIYNHFPGKEEIFIAVLLAHHPYQQIIPALRDSEGETLEDFVREAAQKMVTTLGNNRTFLNLMFIEIVEFRVKHIPQLFDLLFPELFGLVQVLQSKKGQMRDIPFPVILRAFLGLFFSFYLTEALIHEQMPPVLTENALEHFVDIFLHGIVAREPGVPGE